MKKTELIKSELKKLKKQNRKKKLMSYWFDSGKVLPQNFSDCFEKLLNEPQEFEEDELMEIFNICDLDSSVFKEEPETKKSLVDIIDEIIINLVELKELAKEKEGGEKSV